MDMKPLRRCVRQAFDKGAVLAVGLGCLFLYRQHDLPNILGPVSYGIISAGAIGFIRCIIMDFDSPIESAEYQKILRLLDERKAEIQENRNMLEELRGACARFMAMKDILEKWRRNPSLVEDKVTVLEELLSPRDGVDTQRSTSDTTVEVSTSPMGTDTGVAVGETTPKNPQQEPREDISETVQKDILEKVMDEVFKEVLEEEAENVLYEESEKVLEEISEDIQKEIFERVEAEIFERMKVELSENRRLESFENGQEEISEKSLEEIMEKVQKEMLEKAQEGMFEKVQEVESEKRKKEVEHIQVETSKKEQVEIPQKGREEISENQEEVPAKEQEEGFEKGQKEASEKGKGGAVKNGQAGISEKEQEIAEKEFKAISPTQLEEESEIGIEERTDDVKDNKDTEELQLRIEETNEKCDKHQKEKSETVAVELQQIKQDEKVNLEKEIEEFLTEAESKKTVKD